VTGAAPNVSIALPHKATTVGSQVIPAMQDGPRQTVEASFAGGHQAETDWPLRVDTIEMAWH